MGITVSRQCSFLGLACCVLGGANGGFTHVVHAIVQTLAQQLDFRHCVQILVGQQSPQIGNQFFQFALGGGGGVRSSHTSLSV